MPVIDNVVFAFVKIQSPVKKYQSEDTEFSVDCIVSKAQAKAWNKDFPKQKAKEVDNEEFQEKFKMGLPFPEQEEQYVIKVRKNHMKNGKETPSKFRPRVIEKTSDGNVDATMDKLVSNGSKGKLAYTINENDFGRFAQLSSILVEEMIEYKSNGGAGTEFGDVKLKEIPEEVVVHKQEDRFKGAKLASQESYEDLDDTIPF